MSQQTREALAAAITAHFQDEEDGGVVTAWSVAAQVEIPDPTGDREGDLVSCQGEFDGGVFTAMGLTGQWLHDLTAGTDPLEPA